MHLKKLRTLKRVSLVGKKEDKPMDTFINIVVGLLALYGACALFLVMVIWIKGKL